MCTRPTRHCLRTSSALDTYYEQGPPGLALVRMQMVSSSGVVGLMLSLV
jgi:hypothetical protein